ncbi:MAG: KAP family NTPase [Bacteroidetes bacterium]|nr:KAP family NTPase [Bacteroidota bacterium]
MELFRPDRPIDTKNDDKFQRYAFAKRIAEIVSSGKYHKSLVIGVYGKWGAGKTSVLNLIRNEVPENTVVVNFNPWHFSEQQQLLKSFFESIAHALGKKLTTQKEKIAEVLGDYAESVGSVADQVITFGIGSFLGVGKKITEKLRKVSIEDLKSRVDDLIIDANCNFVVFIDDIDRLDVSEIQSVFKLVKLVGDFPRTSYVLSFDDDLVASALGPQYASRDKLAGYAFLEKIIQLPLNLPKTNKQVLRNYTLELVDKVFLHLGFKLSRKETGDFISKFDEAFVPAIDNPRLGVRYANSIGFSIPLLLGEVHISDLMIIEAIKVFYPEFYYFIRNNETFFLRMYTQSARDLYSGVSEDEKKHVKKIIDDKLSIYGDKLKQSLMEMLFDLFPQIKTLYRNYSYPDETHQLWYREKRICSNYYFERYFSYVVKEGDISDVYFNSLFGDLSTVSSDTLKERLEREIDRMKADDLMFKIKQHVPAYNAIEAETLAKVLVQFGDRYSNTKHILIYSTSELTAYIVEKLMRKIAAGERCKLCLELLKLSSPFEFTMKLQYQFRTEKEHVMEESFLNPYELVNISEYIVSRFENEAKLNPLFASLQDFEVREILNMYIEVNKQDDANKLLSDYLGFDNSCALNIIKVFTSTIQSSSKPKPYKTNFNNDSYNEMGRFIELDNLYKKSVEAFGLITYKPVHDLERDELTDENLIALFQKMYLDKQETS